MKKKDIALIEIIQFIGRKGCAGIADIQGRFNIKSDGSGKYKKKDEQSISKRSLGRYMDELCSMNIIKCEGWGSKAVYSINEEKYVYNYKYDSDIMDLVITAIIEKNDINLLRKFNEILDHKYDEDKILKISDRIRNVSDYYKCSEKVENTIVDAICSNKAVNILYKKRTYEIFPVSIVKSSVSDKKYLFYVKKGSLQSPIKLYMIKNAEIIDKTYNVSEDIRNNIKNRWDIDGGPEVQVEVLFLSKGKAAKKIKDKLRECGKIDKLKETDEGFLYKDTIIGITNFRAWLKKYNSIAVVLKPDYLRNEIIMRNEEKLLRYEVE